MSEDNKMSYVDTHCHIHDSEFAVKSDYSQTDVLERAVQSGVDKLICVGTSVDRSRQAVKFAGEHESCFASLAIHPHEVEIYSDSELDQQVKELSNIANNNPARLVAIGECGLDYYYHSNTEIHKRQQRLLELHLELTQKYKLPVIFHIRDPKERNDNKMGKAFADFFTIFDKYQGINGVIHSFSASITELEGVLERGLYVGLNGIMTFTTDKKQLDAAKKVPIDKLLIETDSPFLTPKPLRGTINEPKHVILITQFLSELRGESQALLAKQTTKNAKQLFNL